EPAGPRPTVEAVWARHAASSRPGPPEALCSRTQVAITLEADGQWHRGALVQDSYRFTAAAAVEVATRLADAPCPGGLRTVDEVASIEELWDALDRAVRAGAHHRRRTVTGSPPSRPTVSGARGRRT
ncbi:MAG: hypothetical protein AAF602_19640, partial [Myxococcota bacterium]